MSYHKLAWQEFLKRHNIELTEQEFKQRLSGKKNDAIAVELFGDNLTRAQIAAYGDEKEAVYRELYAPFIAEVKGLTATIQELRRLNIKTAIATTAPPKNRLFAIEALGLDGYFDVILGEEHTSKGKPHPEIYLAAAKELGVDPAHCVAFEDSPPGVQSAKSAGMTVIGILTSHHPSELPQADYLIEDFSQLEFNE